MVKQHRLTEGVADQLDPISCFGPEALSAIPEDMLQEVISQEQDQRRLWEEAPADPLNAEETENASFFAFLAPDSRKEILLTAGKGLLNYFILICREKTNLFGKGHHI